jgi:hypothetical protein
MLPNRHARVTSPGYKEARRQEMRTESVREAVDTAISPSHEEISARAYELYMERPVDAGSDLDDWLRAERELLESRIARVSLSTTRRRATRLAVEHDLATK